MSSRRFLAGALLVFLGVPAGVAVADRGDGPSGPEACVADRINQRRSGGELRWSGSVRDELADHAASMAARGELDHAAMDDRVSGLPRGWSNYGEASYAGPLTGPAGVDEWCRDTVEAFWSSASHRSILADGGYDFVSVGSHWDGETLWVAVGVFAHPTLEPSRVDWPSYGSGLVGGWDGTFYDDDSSVFEDDVERVAAAGVTRGCNPPLNTRFCAADRVTRGEMAAFLARAFGWEAAGGNHFVDDDSSVFERDIETLLAQDVTEGCTAGGQRYCPDRPVTRAEMATLLGRALGLDPIEGSRFADTSDSVHEGYINAVAKAGITVGCNSAGTRFCPTRSLTRGQMAAFLVRAGLAD